MRLAIDINDKNCLYLRKKSKKERWKVICSRGDPECYGSNECNAIECKNPDKMKKLDLGTKSYKHEKDPTVGRNQPTRLSVYQPEQW